MSQCATNSRRYENRAKALRPIFALNSSNAIPATRLIAPGEKMTTRILGSRLRRAVALILFVAAASVRPASLSAEQISDYGSSSEGVVVSDGMPPEPYGSYD